MKLTPKQRKKIYLDVAYRLITGKYKYGNLCDELITNNTGTRQDFHYSESVNTFPEFAEFKPSFEPIYWWDKYDKESRIICMLLCAEMTETENL